MFWTSIVSVNWKSCISFIIICYQIWGQWWEIDLFSPIPQFKLIFLSYVLAFACLKFKWRWAGHCRCFFFFFLMNSCHCFNKWIAYSSFLEYLLNFFFIVVLQVLTEPKNALGKQYKKLFSMNNVSILPMHVLLCSLSLSL